MQNRSDHNTEITSKIPAPSLSTYAEVSLTLTNGNKDLAISFLKRFLSEVKRFVWGDEATAEPTPIDDLSKAKQLQQRALQLQQAATGKITSSTLEQPEKIQPE